MTQRGGKKIVQLAVRGAAVSHSPQRDTWLDEEIATLLEAVEVDERAQPTPESPRRSRRLLSRRSRHRLARTSLSFVAGRRGLGRALATRRFDLYFIAIGVAVAVLIAWLIPRLSTP